MIVSPSSSSVFLGDFTDQIKALFHAFFLPAIFFFFFSVLLIASSHLIAVSLKD